MDDYTRLRGSMGFPADYELGLSVSSWAEKKRKIIYEGCRNYVVKLVCAKDDETITGFFNGFLYCNAEPLLLTSGHIVGWGDATKYWAQFFEGSSLQYRCPVTLLQVGREVTRGAFKSLEPDAALFKVEGDIPPHPSRPFAACASVGDTVVMVGFKAKAEPQLSFSEGLVSHTGFTEHQVTAHADNGYSGSPVFNANGYVIGMVKRHEGDTIKQVSLVKAERLQGWLLDAGQPGFDG